MAYNNMLYMRSSYYYLAFVKLGRDYSHLLFVNLRQLYISHLINYSPMFSGSCEGQIMVIYNNLTTKLLPFIGQLNYDVYYKSSQAYMSIGYLYSS